MPAPKPSSPTGSELFIVDNSDEAWIDVEPMPLQREERPFCLSSEAEGDFEKAVALVPSG